MNFGNLGPKSVLARSANVHLTKNLEPSKLVLSEPKHSLLCPKTQFTIIDRSESNLWVLKVQNDEKWQKSPSH